MAQQILIFSFEGGPINARTLQPSENTQLRRAIPEDTRSGQTTLGSLPLKQTKIYDDLEENDVEKEADILQSNQKCGNMKIQSYYFVLVEHEGKGKESADNYSVTCLFMEKTRTLTWADSPHISTTPRAAT